MARKDDRTNPDNVCRCGRIPIRGRLAGSVQWPSKCRQSPCVRLFSPCTLVEGDVVLLAPLPQRASRFLEATTKQGSARQRTHCRPSEARSESLLALMRRGSKKQDSTSRWPFKPQVSTHGSQASKEKLSLQDLVEMSRKVVTFAARFAFSATSPRHVRSHRATGFSSELACPRHVRGHRPAEPGVSSEPTCPCHVRCFRPAEPGVSFESTCPRHVR